MNMRAAMLEDFSGPAGIRVVEIPVPTPRHGEILVRVICSPVNPSDALYCLGKYSSPPRLPVVPGFEGCGTVVSSGGGWLANRLVGKRVAGAVQSGQGFWAEYVVLKAVEALPMPAEVSDESAASAFVNPLTALGLARPVIKGRHRAMIHTAGASQLGRMLIRLSNRHAFPLINIVHRDALVAELQADGATHVLDSSRADFQESLTSLACREVEHRKRGRRGPHADQDLARSVAEPADEQRAHEASGKRPRRHRAPRGTAAGVAAPAT